MFNSFLSILFFHLLEHIFQVIEIYLLGIPILYAGGLLGLVFPHLIHNEYLHFFFVSFHLIGLFYFRNRFKDKLSLPWWQFAIYFQIFHFCEHLSLLTQFFQGVPMPLRSSPGQYLSHIPRPLLHLLYNSISTLPLFISVRLSSRSFK